jgi:hypothetical protein
MLRESFRNGEAYGCSEHWDTTVSGGFMWMRDT